MLTSKEPQWKMMCESIEGKRSTEVQVLQEVPSLDSDKDEQEEV